jgi:organic radical activating enzyme
MKKIKILHMDRLNLQDDCVFNNPAIILYAAGCKWGCKYCHSKNTWDFNQGYYITVDNIENLVKDFIDNNLSITIIGEGGDFFFQLDDWFEFIKDLKERFNNNELIKVIWYTGAEIEDIIKLFSIEKYKHYKKYFDVILCGKPFYDKEDKNIKVLYDVKNDNFYLVEITPNGGLQHVRQSRTIQKMEA